MKGILIVIISILLVSCSVEQTETVYTIGSIMPLSGEGAVYGVPFQAVILQAQADVNAKWANENKRLEIIFEDGKCNGKDALTAMTTLHTIRGVNAIFGAGCSGETLGIVGYTEANQILVFTPASTSPEVTHAGDFVFRNNPSDIAQVAKQSEYISQNGYKRVAIISENTDFAQALRNGYLEQLPPLGVQVIADEVITPESKDVRTEVTKILSTNPDAVLVMPQTVPMGGVFVRQLREQGFDGQLFVNQATGNQDAIDRYGEQLEGAIWAEGIFAKSDDSSFLALEAQTGCNYGLYCAVAYDGVLLYAEILEKCGDEDTVCMRDALYATQKWNGKFTSDVSFDSNGDVAGDFEILQLVDGKIVKV